MTPTDIQNKRFDKGMSGYKTEDVNTYLTEVASHVQQLEEEKAELERKMLVLAEKVEEYREDEESLRAALIGAQKLGDSVVRDAKKKAEAMLAEASQTAEGMIADAKASLDREALALTRMKKEVSDFKAHILAIYKQHIELVQALPEEVAEPVQQNREEPPAQQVQPVQEETVKPQRLTIESPPESDEKEDDKPTEITLSYEETDAAFDEGEIVEAPVDTPMELNNNKAKRFPNLRFGAEYDLIRKD